MSVILFLFFSLNLLAKVEELDVVEVKATKEVERFTYSRYEEISSDELEVSSPSLIAPAFEKVSGLVLIQSGGPGGNVSFFLRGTESRHVSFTLDGMKINDPSNTDRQFNAAFMTSPFVKEMAVHKGPQAVLYGSDALGGMIEIKSRKGENPGETRFNANAGSFGSYGSSLSHDWKKNDHQGTITASRNHSDGISRLNKKRFNASERDASDVTQFTSSSVHKLTSKIQTDLFATYLHGKSEQDGYGDDNNYDYSSNDQYVLQQKTNVELTENQAISFQNAFNRHQRNIQSLQAGSQFYNGEVLHHEIVHRLEIGLLGLLSGLATEKESSSTLDVDRSFDLHSAFLQSSVESSHYKFHLGGRFDRHTRYGSFFSGSGGLGYKEIMFQYSQGYKAPSLYQLYGPDFMGDPVGNPNLEPETSHFLELNWHRQLDLYEMEISLFQNRLSNLITYTTVQGYLNQQRFISEGVEVKGKLKLTQYQFHSSFTHQQFREEEEVILRRPYNMAQVGVSYFPIESLEFNVFERWFSSRKDYGDTGVVKLNAYEVTDLGFIKRWEKDDVSVHLKNIFNREYEEIYGFNVMPRSIFLNYGHRF